MSGKQMLSVVNNNPVTTWSKLPLFCLFLIIEQYQEKVITSQ